MRNSVRSMFEKYKIGGGRFDEGFCLFNSDGEVIACGMQERHANQIMDALNGDSKQTDLSKQMRQAVEAGLVNHELCLRLAEEAERYYGGMMAWKDAAEGGNKRSLEWVACGKEWLDKTAWVQDQIKTFPLQTLGKHIADVMREEIERMRGLLHEEVAEHNESLMKFYNVDCIESLIEAQSDHIERLRRKLPKMDDPFPPSRPRA